MAKRSAKARRVEARAFALADVGFEIFGLVLIALGLLAALSLITYSPEDPAFRIAPVENGAGVVGASIAAMLVGAMGIAAVVPVLGSLVLGVHFLIGRGMPSLASRFWIGIACLLVALTTLPPLLESFSPARFDSSAGGRLGAFLADAERGLLSGPGALVLNGLLLLVGVLGTIGVAPGKALAALGRGVVAAGRLAARGSVLLGRILREIFMGLVAVAERTGQLFAVWREKRVRRARIAAMRDSDGDEAPESEEIQLHRGRAAPPRLGSKRKRGAPHIVDHREGAARPSRCRSPLPSPRAPLPDPTADRIPRSSRSRRPGARSWDRDSLIMNSRILEKKLQDFGVEGTRGNRPSGAGHHHVRVRAGARRQSQPHHQPLG